MYFYGKRTRRIKTHHTKTVSCEHCESRNASFELYAEYFHFWFIPVWPTARREIKAYCNVCQQRAHDTGISDSLLASRNPIYLYFLPLLFAIIITVIIIGNLWVQQKDRAYVNDPQVGDVHFQIDQFLDEDCYRWVKVKSIDMDSVGFILGNNFYQDPYLNEMDSGDYFCINETLKLSRNEVKSLKDDGHIYVVLRNYDSSSRFNEEHECLPRELN